MQVVLIVLLAGERRNVCRWPKADVPKTADQCPLVGTKRTSIFDRLTLLVTRDIDREPSRQRGA